VTKNNHDIRAGTLQRVNALEARVESLEEALAVLLESRKNTSHRLGDLRNDLLSTTALVNAVDDRLARHQMDTLTARIKRAWRRR
jgi:hypothetical protein